MAGADRQTDKTTRWAFTAYEQQWPLFDGDRWKHPGVSKCGWNAEICPETNRKHYQGYLLLAKQQRFSWLRERFPGVHIEIARDWNKLLNYCRKEETRIPGTQPVSHTNDIPTHFQYAEDVAKRLYERHGIADRHMWTWERHPRAGTVSLLDRLEGLISEDVQSGRRYAAWIATNPAWNAMWKKYGRSFILSYASINNGQTQDVRTSSTPGDEEGESSREEGSEETQSVG